MVQSEKRAIQLNSLAKTKTNIKFSSEARSQILEKRASKRKVSRSFEKEFPLNDDIYKNDTIGKVKDLFFIKCVNQKYSNILSKSIEIFMDVSVWKNKDTIIDAFTPTNKKQKLPSSICLEDTKADGLNYKDLKSLDNVPGNPKYLVNLLISP